MNGVSVNIKIRLGWTECGIIKSWLYHHLITLYLGLRIFNNKCSSSREFKADTYLHFCTSSFLPFPCLTYLDSSALRPVLLKSLVLISEVLALISVNVFVSFSSGVKVVWKHFSPSKVSVMFEMVTCFEHSFKSLLLFVSRRHPGFRIFFIVSFENNKSSKSGNRRASYRNRLWSSM